MFVRVAADIPALASYNTHSEGRDDTVVSYTVREELEKSQAQKLRGSALITPPQRLSWTLNDFNAAHYK